MLCRLNCRFKWDLTGLSTACELCKTSFFMIKIMSFENIDSLTLIATLSDWYYVHVLVLVFINVFWYHFLAVEQSGGRGGAVRVVWRCTKVNEVCKIRLTLKLCCAKMSGRHSLIQHVVKQHNAEFSSNTLLSVENDHNLLWYKLWRSCSEAAHAQ